MRQVACVLFYLCLCLHAQAAEKVRTWTSLDGRTMQAQFVREVDGDATFLKDGKLITVPLDQLSEADRKTIRELEAAQKTDDASGEGVRANSPFPLIEPATARSNDERRPSLAKKETAVANRVWTDPRGNSTTGKFVRIHGRDVVLLRGARTVTFPYDSLTSADQEYVRGILIARGEESLIPPPLTAPEQPPGSSTPAFADAPLTSSTPPSVSPEDGQDGPVAAGGSQAFDQKRARDEEQRQQQALYAAKSAGRLADEPRRQVEAQRSGLKSSVDEGSVRTPLDPELANEVRGSIIIVVVVVGVLGTVGLIVFIAIAIAAPNTAGRRRYSA
jgi:hypothetical protein